MLLGNAQTLLGVLITLIVLCLFHDKTNFLHVLIHNIVEDVKEQVRLYSIKKSEDVNNFEEKGKGQNFDDVRFLAAAGTVMSDLSDKFGRFDTGKEMEMIEIHLFLVSVVVIVCDVFITLSPAWEFFFMLLTFASFMHTSCLWYRVYSMVKSTPSKSSIGGLGKQSHLKNIVGIALLYIALSILSLCVFFIPVYNWSMAFVQFLPIAGIGIYHGYKKWEQMGQKKYSYRFAVKHAIIVLSYPILPALCVYVMLNYSWINDWALSSGLTGLACALNTWCENLSKAYDFPFIGGVFTLYVALYSIVIPVGLGYYVVRKHAKKALKDSKRPKMTYCTK
jgi:hypothetical protein